MLGFLRLKEEALVISGGIVLFLIAIKMIFPAATVESGERMEPFIVPLTTPLGPSLIATLLVIVSSEPQAMVWLTPFRMTYFFIPKIRIKTLRDVGNCKLQDDRLFLPAILEGPEELRPRAFEVCNIVSTSTGLRRIPVDAAISVLVY